MKKFKLLALILALAMIVGLFAGCASGNKDTDTTTKGNDTTAADTKGNEGGDTPAAGVHFTMDGLPTADKTEELARYAARQAEFEEKTGNTYELVTFAYDYQTFAAMLEGGNLPTVFTVANTEPQVLIANGWGRDITDIVKEYGWDQYWNDSLLELVSDKDGKIWGVPNGTYALSLVCNKEVFRQAGLVDAEDHILYPTTWEELIETARTITEKTSAKGFSFTICDNQGGWNFSNVAWNYGADLSTRNDDGSYTSNLNSEAVVNAAKVYQTLAAEGLLYGDPLVDTRDACYTNVSEGLAAMCFGATDSPFNITKIDGNQKMPIENLALIPVPAGPAADYWLMGGDCKWFAPNATDDEVRAWFEYRSLYDSTPNISDDQKAALEEVAARVTGDEYKSIYINGAMNIYKSGDYFDAMMATIEKYKNFDWADYPTFEYTKNHPGHAEEEGQCQQMYAILTSALQAIIENPTTVDVQAVMDEAQSNYQSILDTAFAVSQ